jgi:hypothetical protein
MHSVLVQICGVCVCVACVSSLLKCLLAGISQSHLGLGTAVGGYVHLSSAASDSLSIFFPLYWWMGAIGVWMMVGEQIANIVNESRRFAG